MQNSLTAETPIITSIAPWFGCKRAIADQIVEEFGPHRAYWGLCCGSLAIELAKTPSSSETVIDMHGHLTNLAYVLQSGELAAELYGRLSRTLTSREIFFKAREELMADADYRAPDVDKAYAFFITSWLGRNGIAGCDKSTNFCVRYGATGGSPSTRFQSAISSIPAWHTRLRGLTIIHDSIFNHIDRIDDADKTVIYCDPPYVVKGAKYKHDFTIDDHRKLAEALRRFKRARVLVSYYDHELVMELYRGWTVKRIDAVSALANHSPSHEKIAKKAPEVLLINGPMINTGTPTTLF
jgi:DNA adenine methylase